MQVSISQLKDYLKCPAMSYYAHGLLRVPPEKPKALDIGTMAHMLLDMKMQATRDPSYAIDTTKFGAVYEQASPNAKLDWEKHKLWLPISAFSVPQEWEVIQVEHAMAAGLGNIELVGRLDALIKYNGKFWHVQWKTLGSDKTKDRLSLLENIRLSYHEVAYQFLASRHNYAPWGGTIVGTLPKLPGYRMEVGEDGKRHKRDITDEERCASLQLHFVARKPELQAMLLKNLEANMNALARDWHERRLNTDNCLGGPGRSRCPYVGVCFEGDDIYGERYIQVASRY